MLRRATDVSECANANVPPPLSSALIPYYEYGTSIINISNRRITFGVYYISPLGGVRSHRQGCGLPGLPGVRARSPCVLRSPLSPAAPRPLALGPSCLWPPGRSACGPSALLPAAPWPFCLSVSPLLLLPSFLLSSRLGSLGRPAFLVFLPAIGLGSWS